MVLAPFALLVTVMLVYAKLMPLQPLLAMWHIFAVLPFVAALISTALGIPNIKLKAFESLAILRTGAFSALLSVALFVICKEAGTVFPVVGVALFGLIFFLVSVGLRLAMLNTYLWVLRFGQRRWRMLIYGAGTTGIQLAAALKSHEVGGRGRLS